MLIIYYNYKFSLWVIYSKYIKNINKIYLKNNRILILFFKKMIKL